MAGGLWELVYLSEADFGLGKNDLEDIVAVSQRNNAQENITGMLLYSSGLFIQALEGDRDSVTALFGRISDDRRHHDVELIVDRPIERRSFGSWSMGFVESEPQVLGRQLGIAGALERDEALAVLGQDDELATNTLRQFAEQLY